MFSKIKSNLNIITKIMFIIIFLFMIIIFFISIYKVFFNNSKHISNTEETDIFELTPSNYATILKSVNDDIDSYIGLKIHFTGYVYRLIDFKENEFVLARNMKVNENTNETLIVGFLCTYNNASNFSDGTWVDVTGEISKGNYYGDIAQINVYNMFKIEEPSEKIVFPPDKTYIPTLNTF